MIRFDTLDKKPKVWSILPLSIITLIIVIILMTRETVSVPAVSIVVCIFLTAVIVILLRALVGQLRYNPYSYNTIYYIGFSLFLFSALVSQAFLFVKAVTIPASEVNTVTLFSTLLGSATNYMIYSFPFIFIYSVGLVVSNISLIRHEGKRLVNILGILLAFLLIAGEVVIFAGNFYASGSTFQVMMHDIIINLLASFYLYFECMLIGTIIANIIVVRYEPDKDKDFIIILGCGIRKDGTPTPLLKGRVDRVVKFYRQQIKKTGKAPILVPSGGQGPNEVTTECAAMTGYLLELGIPKEHILGEDRSTSTFENMKFSKEVIRKADPEGKGKIAFATTNYHIFRSGLMARRVKMRAVGMGARTRWYFWPNAAVREFVGLLTEHRLKQALILGGMVLLYLVSTVLIYQL
ncbi:MAG: YdcF family protein [Lachnospiraceae bacterium]|nr:YdcF family protein [Lachnospiraceae bacterium]